MAVHHTQFNVGPKESSKDLRIKIEQPSRNGTPCIRNDTPFFRLPEKIRNKIYEHVVTHSTPIIIHKHCTNTAWYDSSGARLVSTMWRFTPALLRTCRQIRKEATVIFYSTNIFFVTIRDGDISEFVSWLEETCPTSLDHVKNLVLNIEPASFADLLEMTRASHGEAVRCQARQLAGALTEAGITTGRVKVNLPVMRHMSNDALIMRFDADDAERVRMRWLAALEEELNKIEEDGLVDGIKELMREAAKT